MDFHVPRSMRNGPWDLVLQEDLACVRSMRNMLTSQAVFLLMHDAISRHNRSHETKISLIHVDYVTALAQVSSQTETQPKIEDYIFFGNAKTNDYIMPVIRNQHFATLFFSRKENSVHYADSLYLFNFDQSEIVSIATVLGFKKPSVVKLLAPRVVKQPDTTSCGVFAVYFCEMFCNHGVYWNAAKLDVYSKRNQFLRILTDIKSQGEMVTSNLMSASKKKKMEIDYSSDMFPKISETPRKEPSSSNEMEVKRKSNESLKNKMASYRSLPLDKFKEEPSKLNEKKSRGRPSLKTDAEYLKSKNVERSTSGVFCKKKSCDNDMNALTPENIDVDYVLKTINSAIMCSKDREVLKSLKVAEAVLQKPSHPSPALSSTSSDSNEIYVPEKENQSRVLQKLSDEQKKKLLSEHSDGVPVRELSRKYGLSEDVNYFRTQIKRIREEIDRGKPNIRRSYELLAQRTAEMVEYCDEKKQDIHESDIQEIGIQQSACFGLKNFRGSPAWIHDMKQKIGLKSRHIDARVSNSNPEKVVVVEKNIKNFLEVIVPEIIKKYPPEKIYNVDQTAIKYEMTRNRTLTKVGTSRVERGAQRVHALKHSYTLNPCISAAGQIIGTTFVTLSERKKPKSFKKMVEPFPELYITCSTSGIMNSSLANEWLLKVFLPAIPMDSVLLVDSWPGFTKMMKLPQITAKNLKIIVFPKKSTSRLQPLDLSFNRQMKDFLQKMTSQIRHREKEITIAKRENQLKLIRDESLDCKVCLAPFSDHIPGKVPRILPACGHTICHTCARTLQKQSTNKLSIRCPFDRTVTNVTARKLPKNFAIVELVRERGERAELAEKKKAAEICEDPINPCYENPKHESTKYCKTCEVDFCDNCFQSAHSSKIFSSHQFDSVSHRRFRLLKCSDHSNQCISHFCIEKNCNASTSLCCNTCIESLHGNHTMIPIEKRAEDNEIQLTKLLETLNSTEEKMNESLELAKKNVEIVNNDSDEYQSLVTTIKLYFEQKNEEAIGRLNSLLESKNGGLVKVEKDVERDLEEIREAKKEIEKVLERKDTSLFTQEIVEKGEALCKEANVVELTMPRLQEIVDLPLPKTPTTPRKVLSPRTWFGKQ